MQAPQKHTGRSEQGAVLEDTHRRLPFGLRVFHLDGVPHAVGAFVEVNFHDVGIEQEFDLYYSEDGVLLREVPDRDGNDDHGDMLPQELSKAISDFIARKYPGARIVDAEREKGNTEVDIIFAGKALEVCFGTGDAWLWTKTGVRLSEVPDVVRRTLQSSQYGTWVIDDVDLYESPDRVWYAIEVEDPQSEREATVRILEDGTLL